MSELEDRYEIIGFLRKERRATVYRARNRLRGGEFSLKVYPESLLEDPTFDLQIESLRKLQHAAIPALWDMGRSPQVFLVFDLAEGPTLADEFLQVGAFDLPRALQIMEQVLDALKHAHDQGVVHRALTPDKILLVDDAGMTRVKIVEFDSMLDIADAGNAVRRQRQRSGDLAYLAPEQVRGDELTRAADVYAAGAIFYQAITGRPPFRGDMEEVLRLHEHAQPTPPTLLRPELQIPVVANFIDLIARRSLAKKPGSGSEDRYPHAGPFALDLKSLKEALSRNVRDAAHRKYGQIPSQNSTVGDVPAELPSDEKRRTLIELAKRMNELPRALDAEVLSRLIDVRTRETERSSLKMPIEHLQAAVELDQERTKRVILELWWDLMSLHRRAAEEGEVADPDQLGRQIARLEERIDGLRENADEEAELCNSMLATKLRRVDKATSELRTATYVLRDRIERLLPTVDRRQLRVNELIEEYQNAWRDESDP